MTEDLAWKHRPAIQALLKEIFQKFYPVPFIEKYIFFTTIYNEATVSGKRTSRSALYFGQELKLIHLCERELISHMTNTPCHFKCFSCNCVYRKMLCFK